LSNPHLFLLSSLKISPFFEEEAYNTGKIRNQTARVCSHLPLSCKGEGTKTRDLELKKGIKIFDPYFVFL